jgi:tetratricopeptide (TPR) repeat protein
MKTVLEAYIIENNIAMKTIDYSYFIERYIAAEMDEAERRWFELELQGNDALRAELDLRKKADASLVRLDIIDLRNKLAAIERERREKVIAQDVKRTPRFRFAAVITALVLIGSVYLITSGGNSNEAIYNKYFEAGNAFSHSRSVKMTNAEVRTAEFLYKHADYKSAANVLKTYLVRNSNDFEAGILYGLTEMHNGALQKAEESFKSIISNGDNLLLDEAHWYLALCYIKTDERENAVTQLESIINSNSGYKDRAKKILRKIK